MPSLRGVIYACLLVTTTGCSTHAATSPIGRAQGITSAPAVTTEATPTRSRPTLKVSAVPLSEPAPTCRSEQLESAFRGGGYGTGNDIADVLVRNTARPPCRLHGHVHFTAAYASGRTDRPARAERNAGFSPQFSSRAISVTLGDAARRSPHDGLTLRYLDIVMMGAEREDPRPPNGECHARDERTPRWLDIRIGRTQVHVLNEGPLGPADLPSVYGCRGQITLAAVLKRDP
jgi:hypothetical protein